MKNLSKQKKILLVALGIILSLCLIIFLSFNYIFGGLKKVDLNKSKEVLGWDDSIKQEYPDKEVINIAVFGLDGRDLSVNEGRSDSLMILSIDTGKNCIKLTSILRDSYVAIEGHGHEKICHAYSYGGPELAIKTLNKNFKLDIKDYVTANFAQFADIVNYMGGVDINITQAEMIEINKMVGTEAPQLDGYGVVHLNGIQALHYTRIRYIDSDTVRANRQRNVLEALFTKAKKSGIGSSISLVKNIMPMLETSLDRMTILNLAQKFLGGGAELKQEWIPNKEENAIGGIYEGAWVWRYDLDAASKRLKKFIYE